MLRLVIGGFALPIVASGVGYLSAAPVQAPKPIYAITAEFDGVAGIAPPYPCPNCSTRIAFA